MARNKRGRITGAFEVAWARTGGDDGVTLATKLARTEEGTQWLCALKTTL